MFILQKDNYTELQDLLDLASTYWVGGIVIAPLGPGGIPTWRVWGCEYLCFFASSFWGLPGI